MEEQLKTLMAEVRELKERVAYLEKQAGVTANPVDKPFTSRPAPAQREWPSPGKPQGPSEIIPGRMPQARSKGAFELNEVKLAGTWFNRLGILAIMLAVAFFLKWSFDNHLIGELGRIVIGIVIGVGFLAAGEYFQRRKYHIFGQGFTGGGIAILYFSIFAAFVFYHLLSQPLAFLLMVAITLAASLLAVRYDSMAIGIIGLVGGFATPFLLSDGQSSKVILYTYFAILDAGVLLVAYFKKWPLFNYLTFLFTFAAFPAGFAGPQASSYLRSFDTLSFAYLTLFFLIYLAISFLWNIRVKAGFFWADVSLILLNAATYFAFSYVLLNPHIGDWIGFWALGLGVIYLLMGLFIRRRYPATQKLNLSLLAAAAGFVTLAIPLQVDGYWIPMAWAMEAVIIFYLSFKINPDKVPLAGFIMLFLTIFSLFVEPFRITGQEAWIFLNKGAVAYLVVILAMAFIIRLYYNETRDNQKLRRNYLFFGLQVALNLMIILFLTLETDAYFDYRRSLPQETMAFLNSKNLVLSLLWGMHAAILVVLGFWRRLKGIRWFGLGFLGLVILKVFLFDLSSLSTPNRILSFMALGIILLAVSWLYHRYKNQIMGGNEDEDQVNL